MDILIHTDIFIAGFAWVFLLGVQQQNITGEHHIASATVSYALAFVFAILIQGMTSVSLLAFTLLYGTGSALGASLSIIFHKRFLRKPA